MVITSSLKGCRYGVAVWRMTISDRIIQPHFTCLPAPLMRSTSGPDCGMPEKFAASFGSLRSKSPARNSSPPDRLSSSGAFARDPEEFLRPGVVAGQHIETDIPEVPGAAQQAAERQQFELPGLQLGIDEEFIDAHLKSVDRGPVVYSPRRWPASLSLDAGGGHFHFQRPAQPAPAGKDPDRMVGELPRREQLRPLSGR